MAGTKKTVLSLSRSSPECSAAKRRGRNGTLRVENKGCINAQEKRRIKGRAKGVRHRNKLVLNVSKDKETAFLSASK